MKRLPGLFVALAILAGCAPSVVPGSTTPSQSSDPSSPSDELTTQPESPPATVTQQSGPPVGWIAPSGVPVAVTAVNGERIEVLTPCGNPAVLTGGTPIYDVDVLIDPGHGGPVDTGAVAPNTGMPEKEINLRVGLAVHEQLTARGINSMMTRTADYPIPIRTRTTYSDIVGAEAVVSIHHNGPEAPPSEIPGVEIFVQNGTPESARLGGLLYEETMAALDRFEIDWDRSPDAGVMTVLNSEGEDAYGMVRLPQAPSALLELGYIANPAEAELHATVEYVPAAATAIADAIEAFLTSDAPGSPLVEGRMFNPGSGVGRDQCVEPDLGASASR